MLYMLYQQELNAGINAFDSVSIMDFILGLLPKDKRYVIIADGLEDVSDAEITDVILGLRRLMQHRIVLLCYSSRSGSRFHRLANDQITSAFSVSHDDFKHDEEIEAYIVEELIRRNATRHLSPDLEELVKKQLLVGAQGMYLWASLQLDAIFPADSKVVVTDDQIRNLITHLPRDLPEAFERAMERITDRRYEGRIMKLVISAVTPLHIDEMRVALSIVLGEPVWHGDRIAKDGAQLISLCGGNLLDLDEEDRKVRFIHHSVIQHLLLPAASPSTTAYHFTLEDAQNFTGSTCVTYLNLPTFDDRMTIARNLKSDDLLDNIVQSNQQNSSVVSRVVQHIRFRDNKRGRTSQIDIGRVVAEIQAARIKDDLDPRSFLRYATSNWLSHTALFDEEIQDCKKTWKLWWRLLYGGVAIVTPPCPDIAGEPLPALLWAVKKAHGSLFRNIICETSLHLSQIEELMHALEVHRSIHGQWLGDLLAQYLKNVQATGRPPSGSTANNNNITLLLDLGADPATPHHISGSVPLEMLIPIITSTDFGAGGFIPAKEFVRRIFAYPAVQKSLDDPVVLSILEIYLCYDEFDMLAVISAVRPDLRLPRHRGGPGEHTPVLPIEKLKAPEIEAPEIERWEDIESLARKGQLNKPTSSGSSLLLEAIETRDDAWVYHLLCLGADPNFEPPPTRPTGYRIHTPDANLSCNPLQSALRQRRTRVCLELLRHGANVDQIGLSHLQIARDTGNAIMVARLQECTGGQQHHKQGHTTALATACSMLFSCEYSSMKAPLEHPKGFARSYRFDLDWRWALDKIIYSLALDADAEYVNAQDEEGETALHHVSKASGKAALRLNTLVHVLLSQGADTNLVNRRGETPLFLAIQNKFAIAPINSLVRPLLDAGADPNAACPWPFQECSLLHLVMGDLFRSARFNMKLVHLLLQAGADPRDPLDLVSPDPSLLALARERHMEELVGALEEYTRKLNGRQEST